MSISDLAKLEQQTGIVCSVLVSAGKKGVAGAWTGGGVDVGPEDAKTGKREVSGFVAAGVSTAVGGVGYMAGKHHGWYGGVNAPYVSYGRGNPLLGDTFSVSVPLVGSATISRSGGLGAQAQFTWWGVRPGGSVFVTSPALRVVTEPFFEALDHVVVPLAQRAAPVLAPLGRMLEPPRAPPARGQAHVLILQPASPGSRKR